MAPVHVRCNDISKNPSLQSLIEREHRHTPRLHVPVNCCVIKNDIKTCFFKQTKLNFIAIRNVGTFFVYSFSFCGKVECNSPKFIITSTFVMTAKIMMSMHCASIKCKLTEPSRSKSVCT